MKRIALLTFLILGGLTAYAQVSYPYILNPPTVAPSGACSGPQIQVLGSNGVIYSCNNGTWAAASGGGTGTVTSVTFTGDGVVDSSTPSSAVTTTGTVTATLLTQTANTAFGNFTGSTAAPSFTATTGTGSPVAATSPTLVTPLLGTPTSGVITNLSGTCTGCNANIASGAAQSITVAGAASTPGLTVSGLPFAGTGTTSTPQLSLGSAAPTTWSTAGTYIGISPPTGFTGNVIDAHAVNGGNSVFNVTAAGGLTVVSTITTTSGSVSASSGTLTGKLFASATNCSSSASPAVCAAASAGSVVVAASATTVVVDTTAVTANSQVFVQEDSSLGTKLSVTCNTTPATAPPTISARTGGTSFTITTTAPTTNPRCFSYWLIN